LRVSFVGCWIGGLGPAKQGEGAVWRTREQKPATKRRSFNAEALNSGVGNWKRVGLCGTGHVKGALHHVYGTGPERPECGQVPVLSLDHPFTSGLSEDFPSPPGGF
ncbi:hypothetical protein CLOM_g5687, partial [Closterium sp. NIES-68]